MDGKPVDIKPAVIVADPWHGKGLGEKLISRVIEIARDNGVKSL